MDSGSSSKPAAQTDAVPITAAAATTTPAVTSPQQKTMIPATQQTSKPAAPTAASPAAAAPKAASKPKRPPPGYKIISRPKPDGTVAYIFRKMTPEELAAAGQTAPPAAAVEKPGVQYKIVMAKDANGAMIRVKRPINGSNETTAPSSTTSAQAGLGAPKLVTKTSATTSSKPAVTAAKSQPNGPVGKSENKKTPVPTTGDDKKPAATTTTPTITITENAGTSGTQEPIDQARALAEQKEAFRRRRTHRMKGRLLSGFGSILGTSIGNIDMDDLGDVHNGGGYEDGGQIETGDILDSDQSLSESDDDDNFDTDHDRDTQGSHAGDNHHHHYAAGAAGNVVTGMTAAAASSPPKPTPTVGPDPSQKNDPTMKDTYKFTKKDLEVLEKQTNEDLERPLRHHWANFSFYVMAALSVVLPLFFLCKLFYSCFTSWPFNGVLSNQPTISTGLIHIFNG
jgi:hypothetical protein